MCLDHFTMIQKQKKNGVVNNFQTITEADELGQENYVRLVTLLLDG